MIPLRFAGGLLNPPGNLQTLRQTTGLGSAMMIGKLIQRTRKARRLSGDKLALRCNVSPSCIYRWEREDYILPKHLPLLARSLSIALKTLQAKNGPRQWRGRVGRGAVVIGTLRFIAITSAYKTGEPLADIQARFDCSEVTVVRYARLAKLPKRPHHLPADIRAAVIADYKDTKMTVINIARAHGVSMGYVSRVAREAGFARFKRKPTGGGRPLRP